jgi:UDPglucose 6-dehydrogenase
MKIAFIGLGQLGLPVALAIDMKGHDVLGYDINPNIRPGTDIKDIFKTKEEGVNGLTLEQILDQNHLRFASSVKEVMEHADITFVAVQTPHDKLYEGITRIPNSRKDFNYGWLVECMENISRAVDEIGQDKIVIVISTVLPGTMAREVIPKLSKHVLLCYNPYFIAMGTTFADFLYPEFILFGVINEYAYERVVEFYRTITDAQVYKTTIESAELIKVSYNTMISTKILFANLIMEMCDKLPNTNVDDVTNALKLSSRRLISPAYLTGGMGDGGGCHPRDNIAMSWLSNKLDLSVNFFDHIMVGRECQAEYLADLVVSAVSLTGINKIMILGKAFKAETNLIDGSPSILVRNLLKEKGHETEMYDPYYDAEVPSDLLIGPKIYFIGTKHRVFADYEFPTGSYIIDPHRYIQAREGIQVYSVGVGNH